MSSVTIDFDHSAEVLALIEGAAVEACKVSGEALIERMRAKLHEPKSGATYYSTSKPSPHKASAPGEPPAHWEGTLEKAIKQQPIEGGVEVYVDHAEAPYAEDYLEYGSAGGKIAARPFFWPSKEEHEAEHKAIIDAAVQAVTR